MILPVEDLVTGPQPPLPSPQLLLGRSREGREIHGWRLGGGPLRVSLIAGCHADEPVGPALLERLVAHLAALPPEAPALAAATWSLVPHVNPDGRAANAGWQEHLTAAPPTPRPEGGEVPRDETAQGYDLALYLRHVVRELPGDDTEFGFPRGPEDAEARPENRAVAAFLAAGAPFHLHATLHGMAFAAGPWYLLEAAWGERTRALQQDLARRTAALGYRLHDVDRKGEKGFRRLSEGFSTRPDSRAMAEHFRQRGDEATARLFRPSSMEYVRSLGGDPLTLVSEMPLFLAQDPPPPASEALSRRPPLPENAEGRDRFRAWLGGLARAGGAETVRREAARAGLRPMPLADQWRLQLAFVEAGLAAVRGRSA